MGFYLRKSLRVGPVRFNLSKSGVGVSGGVRGFRVGAGPRGNYVHMGRHGLYYRATLPSGSAGGSSASALAPRPSGRPDRPLSETPMRVIESGDVSQMRDTTSADLLNEFDQKRRRTRLAPIVSGVAVILVIGLAVGTSTSWAIIAAVAIGIAAVLVAHLYDQMSKTVVLFYEIEADSERDYQALHDAFEELRSSARSWHVEAEGDVMDRKRSAGATSVVRRKLVALSKSPPPFVKTNIEIPAVPVGRQTLYFFPDRILVFDRNSVGSVAYADLDVERRTTRFIENGSLPQDATVVDRTWKYVNKKGGPDRRFKDNKEIPVALYEDLRLRSRTGLNELLQFSKADVARSFEAVLQSLAKHVLQSE